MKPFAVEWYWDGFAMWITSWQKYFKPSGIQQDKDCLTQQLTSRLYGAKNSAMNN